MRELVVSIWAESIKMRKSNIFIITLVAFIFIGMMMGLMMYVAGHPEIAGRSATLSAKASAFGKEDWPSFYNVLMQIILALGQIGFGMVAGWVFGREYIDRVVKDLLALPVSRTGIVISKFIIIGIWCILLTLVLFISGILVGLAIRIPGWSSDLAIHSFVIFTKASLLTMLLCTPVAFLASVSRGYLLPLGFAILMLILTNLVAAGIPNVLPYFPWGIPALCSGIGGNAMPHASIVNYSILAATSILGFTATAIWWRFADQK